LPPGPTVGRHSIAAGPANHSARQPAWRRRPDRDSRIASCRNGDYVGQIFPFRSAPVAVGWVIAFGGTNPPAWRFPCSAGLTGDFLARMAALPSPANTGRSFREIAPQVSNHTGKRTDDPLLRVRLRSLLRWGRPDPAQLIAAFEVAGRCRAAPRRRRPS